MKLMDCLVQGVFLFLVSSALTGCEFICPEGEPLENCTIVPAPTPPPPSPSPTPTPQVQCASSAIDGNVCMPAGTCEEGTCGGCSWEPEDPAGGIITEVCRCYCQ